MRILAVRSHPAQQPPLGGLPVLAGHMVAVDPQVLVYRADSPLIRSTVASRIARVLEVIPDADVMARFAVFIGAACLATGAHMSLAHVGQRRMFMDVIIDAA